MTKNITAVNVKMSFLLELMVLFFFFLDQQTLALAAL